MLQGNADALFFRLGSQLRHGGDHDRRQFSRLRVQGNDAGFQSGGFHQGVDEELELLGLALQGLRQSVFPGCSLSSWV